MRRMSRPSGIDGRARRGQRRRRPGGGLGRGTRRRPRSLLITKGSPASCNTGKAQGGIQAAIGADDSPEQHAGDVYRSSHETADLRAGRGADRRGAGARSPGWRGSASSSRARATATGWPAAAARSRQAAAPGGRPHRPRHRPRAARRRWPPRASRSTSTPPLVALEPAQRPLRGHRRARRASGARSTPPPWCWPPAAAATPRRAERGVLTTNQPGATGEVGRIAARARRRGARRRTRSSTTPTAAPGRPRCRATRSPRRRAATARCW